MTTLKELIFKPRWTHKNPQIRATAVSEESDPRLVDLLPELAAQDPAAEVRLQAIKRLSDPLLLLDLLNKEPDLSVRQYLTKTLRQMMVGQHKPDPHVEVKQVLFEKLCDKELAEWLVRKASDSALRQSALDQVERDGLIGDVAINDPDPQLRAIAADRVQTDSTLERVARETRRKDKRTFRLVSDKLQARRLESGDENVMREIAESLCEAVEKLVRSDDRASIKTDQLKAIENKWQGLNRPPADVAARFISACRIVESSLASPDDDPLAALRGEVSRFTTEAKARLDEPDATALQNLVSRGEKLLERTEPGAIRNPLVASLEALVAKRDQLIADQQPSPSLMQLCKHAEQAQKRKYTERKLTDLRAQWHQEWNRLSSHRPADQLVKKRFDSALQQMANSLAEQAETAAIAAQSLPDKIARLEASLEAGDLAAAAAALRDCQDTAKAAPASSANQKNHLNELAGKVRELRDWQHWSNNKMRSRLIERATELTGSGLHPDAVTARLKELNARWKELDRGEKLPGDPPGRMPHAKQYRQFRAACDQAFEPAKVFFEKRTEVREQHQGELEELCQKLAAAQPGDDIKTLEKLVRDGRGALRKLTEVPPKQRAKLARRLRENADTIDGFLNEHYQNVERRKEALIEEVQALIEEPDLDKALSAAKEAQRRWQAAGRTRRARDQKLWTRYRAVADQVFGRLDAQRDADKAARKDQLDALDALLVQAKDLAKIEPQEALGQLSRIRQQVAEVGVRSKRHDQELARIADELEARKLSDQRAKEVSSRQARRELATLCATQEQRLLKSEPVDRDMLLAALQHCDPAPPQGLEDRVRALVEEQVPDPATLAQNFQEALEICLELEFLSGTPTPDEYSEQRMAFQVKRLSQRMSGEQSKSAKDEAENLECRWLACGPLVSDQAKVVTARFHQAMKAFEQSS